MSRGGGSEWLASAKVLADGAQLVDLVPVRATGRHPLHVPLFRSNSSRGEASMGDATGEKQRWRPSPPPSHLHAACLPLLLVPLLVIGPRALHRAELVGMASLGDAGSGPPPSAHTSSVVVVDASDVSRRQGYARPLRTSPVTRCFSVAGSRLQLSHPSSPRGDWCPLGCSRGAHVLICGVGTWTQGF